MGEPRPVSRGALGQGGGFRRGQPQCARAGAGSRAWAPGEVDPPPVGGGNGEHLPAPPEDSGNKQQNPGGAGRVGCRPNPQQRALPGPRWPDPLPATREPPLPRAYPARPAPVLHPHGAPASRAHLRGLEPGRPGLAPLRARCPLPPRLRGGRRRRRRPPSLGTSGRGAAGRGLACKPPPWAEPHSCKPPSWGGASRANRPHGRSPTDANHPPGAEPRMQIKFGRCLWSLSSGAVMNNSTLRSLGANQKAATAIWAAALPGSGKARRRFPPPRESRAPSTGRGRGQRAGRAGSHAVSGPLLPAPFIPQHREGQGPSTKRREGANLPAKEMERLNRKLKP